MVNLLNTFYIYNPLYIRWLLCTYCVHIALQNTFAAIEVGYG